MIETEKRKIIRVPAHINDPEFSEVVVQQWKEISSNVTDINNFDTVNDNNDKKEIIANAPILKQQSQQTQSQTLEKVNFTVPLAHESRRATLLRKFHEMIKNRIPIIGGGAGVGISAKSEENGGIDLIVIYNSGLIIHLSLFQ